MIGVGPRAAAAAVAALALASCYKPNITDNGFQCSADKRCPEGYTCGANNRCSLHPVTVMPPPQDTGMEVMSMPLPDGGGGGEPTCAAPTALCQQGPAPGDVCSPACQTGCACGRCNVVHGKAACVPAGTAKLGDICNPTADNCGPGLICLAELCGNGLARCYQHCITADQCGGVACGITINDDNNQPTPFLTCDVPPSTCDPVTGGGCPSPAWNCYLSSSNQTVCDCPTNANPAKQGMNNAPCVDYNDCAPGFTCISIPGVDMQSGAHCHFVCDITKPNSCPPGEQLTCMPTVPGAKYGFCSN
jgi:hypothetical protein